MQLMNKDYWVRAIITPIVFKRSKCTYTRSLELMTSKQQFDRRIYNMC